MSLFSSSPAFVAATHDERVPPPRRWPAIAWTGPCRCSPRRPLISAMQVQPIVNSVQAALAAQGSLAGGDAAVEDALDHLVTALAPAIRQAAMDLAEQAACEVRFSCPTAPSISCWSTAIRRFALPRQPFRATPARPKNSTPGSRCAFRRRSRGSSKRLPRRRAPRSTAGCSTRCRGRRNSPTRSRLSYDAQLRSVVGPR